MSRPKPKAVETQVSTGVEAARNATSFAELCDLVAAVDGGPLETFSARQRVRTAADRRTWELSRSDPRLAARLRMRLAPPGPGATAQEHAECRLARNWRVAIEVAAEESQTRGGPTP